MEADNKVTVIVSGKEIQIKKSIIDKSDLLSSLYAIQGDRIELLNIELDEFQFLMYMFQYNDNQKDVAKLYEYMGFHIKCRYLDNYCNVDECTNLAFNENKYCELHTCPVDNCKNKRNNKYCVTHTCIRINCHNLRVTSTCCDLHKCAVERCEVIQYYDNSVYCHIHKCTLCERLALFKLCELHKCSVEGCCNSKQNTELSNGFMSPYCDYHTCNANNCNIMSLNGKCCDFHKCIAFKCPYTKMPGFTYCIGHRCNKYNCDKIRRSTSKYCVNHICKLDSCDCEVIGDMKLCFFHKCSVTECCEVRNYGGKYCLNHKCRIDYCWGLRINEDYCINHTY